MVKRFRNGPKQRSKKTGDFTLSQFTTMCALWKVKDIVLSSAETQLWEPKQKLQLESFPFGLSAAWSLYFLNIWRGIICNWQIVTDWFQHPLQPRWFLLWHRGAKQWLWVSWRTNSIVADTAACVSRMKNPTKSLGQIIIGIDNSRDVSHSRKMLDLDTTGTHGELLFVDHWESRSRLMGCAPWASLWRSRILANDRRFVNEWILETKSHGIKFLCIIRSQAKREFKFKEWILEFISWKHGCIFAYKSRDSILTLFLQISRLIIFGKNRITTNWTFQIFWKFQRYKTLVSQIRRRIFWNFWEETR